MDSSRRSEPQQFKSITVLRHPVFLGSKPQENGVLGLRRACPTRLANEDGTHGLIVEGVSLPERLQLKLVESKIFASGCVALVLSEPINSRMVNSEAPQKRHS
jgi:hypothetical protein